MANNKSKNNRNKPCECGSGIKFKKCCGRPNNNSVKRDPGDKIKSILRNEVNFGCPVRANNGEGCGSPILTYHHFAPPWKDNYIHNVEGMIALCPQHHHQADGGLWTKSQLKEMKRNPFIDHELKIAWPWRPEVLTIKIGPHLVVGGGSPLRFRGKKVLGFSPQKIDNLDINTTIFDSNIIDDNGFCWLKIEDGWLNLDIKKTKDLRFTPQTKSFEAKHLNKNIFLDLHYKIFKVSDFINHLREFKNDEDVNQFISNIDTYGIIDSDENIPLVTVNCHLKSPEIHVKAKNHKITFQSFLPGLEEKWDSKRGVICNDQHRLNFSDNKGKPFFSIG